MKKNVLLLAAVIGICLGSSSAWGQTDTAQVPRSQLKNGRLVPVFGSFYSWMVLEQGNLFFTNDRARAAVSAVSPLSYNATNGQFSLTGLSGLGTANQIPGMNSGATGLEWKTLAGGTIISVTHGAGTVTLGVNANSIGAGQLATGSVGTDELIDSTIAGRDIANAQVVRELNGFKDEIVIAGEGGATVRTASGPVKDSIIVNAGSGGGGGSITAIQNGDGKITVTNPNGPTTTLNITAASLDSADLKNASVPSGKIRDSSIQRVDVVPGFKAYDSDGADLADSALTAAWAKKADSAGTVADNAVTSAKILNGTIQTADFNAAAKAPLAGISDSALQAAHAYRADSAGKTSHTGVAATSYGSAGNVAQITLNLEGRVTSASNTPIVIGGGGVTDGSLTIADMDTVTGAGIPTTWDTWYFSGDTTFGASDTITITRTGVSSAWTGSAGLTSPPGFIMAGLVTQCSSNTIKIISLSSPATGAAVSWTVRPKR